MKKVTVFMSYFGSLFYNKNMGKWKTAMDWLSGKVPGGIQVSNAFNMFRPKWKKSGKKAPVVKRFKVTEQVRIPSDGRRTYCWMPWEGHERHVDGVIYPHGVHPVPNMMNVTEELDTIDWSKIDKNTTVFVFNENGDFICAKISRRAALEMGGKKGANFDSMRTLFCNIFWSKPDVSRGASRCGVGLSYKCIGWRLGFEKGANKLQQYTFNGDVCPSVLAGIMEGMSHVARRLEALSKRVMNSIKDFDYFMEVKKFIDLPSVAGTKDKDGKDIGIFTQTAMASDGYWSNMHVDDDFFFTIISVLAGNKTRDDEVIYTFNFPTFGISIPMKSGDVIVYDSKVPHCTSNAKYSDSYIYSMYVSEKSVNCNAWIKFKEANPKEAGEIERKLEINKLKRKR